jgi:AcrR family transcriptional regulator
MPKKPSRPRDVRRAVLDASLRLVDKGGVGALSMREVARRARVTHGAPYHYFPDRAAILAALAEEGFELLAKETVVATQEFPQGRIERFEACGLAYFRFALKHPAYMRIMFRPELVEPMSHPSVDAAAARAMTLLIECIGECQASGTIRKGDSHPIVVTSWAAMHGLAALWLDGPLRRVGLFDEPPEQLASAVARTLGEWVGRT